MAGRTPSFSAQRRPAPFELTQKAQEAAIGKTSMMRKLGGRLAFKRGVTTNHLATKAQERNSSEDQLETLDDEFDIVNVDQQTPPAMATATATRSRAGISMAQRPVSYHDGLQEPSSQIASPPATAILRHRTSSSSLASAASASSSSRSSVIFPSSSTTTPGTAIKQPQIGSYRNRNTSTASMSNMNTVSGKSGVPTSFKAATISSPSKASRQAGQGLVRKTSASDLESVATNNRAPSSNALTSRRISASYNHLPSLTSTAGTATRGAPHSSSTQSHKPVQSSSSSPSSNSPHRRSASTITTGSSTVSRIPAAKGSKTFIPTSRLGYGSTSASIISNSGSSNNGSSYGYSSSAAATPRPTGAASHSRIADLSINTSSSQEDSPGLEVLVANTTIQMQDLAEMLSPLANINQGGNNRYKQGNEVEDDDNDDDLRRQRRNEGSLASADSMDISILRGGGAGGEEGKENRCVYEDDDDDDDKDRLFDDSEHSLEQTASPTLRNAGTMNKNKSKQAKGAVKLSTESSAPPPLAKFRPAPNGPLTRDGLPLPPSLRQLSTAGHATSNAPSHSRDPHLSGSESISLSPAPDQLPSSSSSFARTHEKASSDLADLLCSPIIHGNDESTNLDSPSRQLSTAHSTALMHSELSDVSLTPIKAGGLPSRSTSDNFRRNAFSVLQGNERQGVVVNEELIEHERQKSALDHEKEKQAMRAELIKSKKEMEDLRKMLARHADDANKLVKLEGALDVQSRDRRLLEDTKQSLETLTKATKREKMKIAIERASHRWASYEKDLANEKIQIQMELATLASLKGLLEQMHDYIIVLQERPKDR